MKNFVRKPKKIPLEAHKGCKECMSHCTYNKPCTTKSKNQQASDVKYGCNSSKGK